MDNMNDLELLQDYVQNSSQAAFSRLVELHIDLVYSAVHRMLRDAHLAQDVTQEVFSLLARKAAGLGPGTILSAWLYRSARNLASETLRRESRRRNREQLAVETMNLTSPDSSWQQVEPLLDESMAQLSPADHDAIVMRYFQNRSLKEVGAALGASEDAAQKRVSRAVEQLRELLSKRKAPVGAGALAALMSANAVQAAPAGLAATVVAGAALGASAIVASTGAAIAQTIVMTTTQKIILVGLVAGAVGVGLYGTRQALNSREQLQGFRQRQAQLAALSNEVQELRIQRDRASNALAALTSEQAVSRKGPDEVLKLRGQVGRLQQEKARINSASPLSKLTADPEARTMLRTQQKLSMSKLYSQLVRELKLPSDQVEKFSDLLADRIMEDVDLVTTALRDKPGAGQLAAMFDAQNAATKEKMEALLGTEGAARYQDYTRDLLTSLSTEQFMNMASVPRSERKEKSQKFRQAMQTATQAALAEAGLPEDYQTIPVLNFRNIASEQEGERSLKLMEDIYNRTAASAGGFLKPEELAKFEEYKTGALKNSRSALLMNRTMMAPIGN
jgi:RNA polymerase sigma factor (sigma-70 family)